MNKILFLDIDGVLNSFDNMRAMTLLNRVDNSFKDSDINNWHFFDERCVTWLRFIINQTDCKIVISSTWRRMGLSVIQLMWEERNLPGEIIDCTVDVADEEYVAKYLFTANNKERARGIEIQQWLDNNECESYCIVDDDSDMLSTQNFVQTNGAYGIDYNAAHKIIAYLKGEKINE